MARRSSVKSRGTNSHTPFECLSVASSSDTNARVDVDSYACSNCWFIEGEAQYSEDTHASQETKGQFYQIEVNLRLN